MQTEEAPYRPVYHFQDERLFEVFLAAIPHNELVQPIQTNQSMRNKYFRGFHISGTSPSRQLVLSAYKKEIIDQSNGTLASFLCERWIRQHPEITNAALKGLGIHSDDATNPYSWLDDVHAKLQNDPNQENVRALVQSLAQAFPAEDVLIFVSVIGYEADQKSMRNIVDAELDRISKDPNIVRGRLTLNLQEANAALKSLEQDRAELERDWEAETVQQQATLDRAVQEHDQLSAVLPSDGASIQELVKRLEGLKTELAERERVSKVRKRRNEELSKIIERQRKQMASVQSTYELRRGEIDRRVHEQHSRLASLAAELEQIGERVLEEERNQAIQLQTTTEAPLIPMSVARAVSELIGNNAICYQGIQRTFRNAVVGFLRERLPRLFPTDHVQRMKSTFGEEWDKAAQNASQSRKMYGTTTAIQDEYDLLGTNHFFGLFERYFDKLFTSEVGQSAQVPKPVKPRFLGNLKAIKDSRDPLSHPVQEEISFEEAHHLLISAKQILRWLGSDAQAAELSALAEQLDRVEGQSRAILRRLPSEDSIYLEFVGREVLLGELANCFTNPDNRRCLLDGDGGKGKSAVAYRFAQELSNSTARFQMVVWLSAKLRKFRGGTITSIDSPDFTTAEEAINRLLSEYGATAQDMEKSLSERKKLLFDYLNELPAFIVADDIDTLLEDVDVVSLFTYEIPQTQSAVLLTSRRAIPGIRSYTLQGFDALEAEQFIKSRIQLYGLDARPFSPAVISEITTVTDGSPLYIDDLMRLAQVIDIKSAMRMWAEKKGDDARKYALARELESLSEDAKKVLIAAAVTDDPISFAELETILTFSEERLVSALRELQTLFLFPRIPEVEGEQRYQINLNTRKLVRLVTAQTSLYERIEGISKALAGKLPAVGHGILSPLIRQAQLRLSAGQTTEAETILLGAINKYPNAPDLRGFLGYLYKRVGRTADARTQFEAAFKLKAKSSDMFLHWIRMEMAEKEWSKAVIVADRALKVLPNLYEAVELKAFSLRQAGFDFHARLHREKAEKMWTEAVEEIQRRIKLPDSLRDGERRVNASMYQTMVICLEMLNRVSDRNDWLERWESEHPDDLQVDREKEIITRRRGNL